VLRVVRRDLESCCGRCVWHRFCRGCALLCTEEELVEKLNPLSVALAIDWDPTALHLRYQTSLAHQVIEHASVQEAMRKQTESVALSTCLESFTKEEELGDDEKYMCSKCGSHQLAVKKLQIWRLPPMLVSANYILKYSS